MTAQTGRRDELTQFVKHGTAQRYAFKAAALPAQSVPLSGVGAEGQRAIGYGRGTIG